MTDERIHRELGSIGAKLDSVDDKLSSIIKRLDDHEARLRDVEHKAVRNGLLAGGIISVGIAFLKHKLGW